MRRFLWHLSSLVGPDGCLGDAARPGEIAAYAVPNPAARGDKR